MERTMYKFGEVVYDITVVMATMILADQICIEDSREAYATVFDLAQRFEFDEEQGDYMLAVEEFAQRELLAKYRTQRIEEMER